ncbi:MAG TPA: carbamoyltransferase C-terminal domain-containing protein, partial [Pyrinomonadaceae bacterium]
MSKDTWVLGISASPHNGGICLLKGDEIFVAIQEERLSRRKRDAVRGAQPSLALNYCLDYAGIHPRDLSMIVCCVTNRAKVPAHDVSANPVLQPRLYGVPTLYIPHHYGHAVSAFATSGFAESAVLVIDGLGSPAEDFTEEERAACRWPVENGYESISLYAAADAGIKPLEKHLVADGAWIRERGDAMPFFGSLGGMYSAAAKQIFGDLHEAGKVMGLAPYGRPTTPPHDFFAIEDDGRLVFRDAVPARYGHGEHWPLRQDEYQNLAASTQAALEEAITYLVEHLHQLCPSDNLCYAGGVALNSVMNERIIRESPFKNSYFMPAAEDSGTAIGAAYYGLWRLTKNNSRRKLIHDAVGRRYSQDEVARAVTNTQAVQPLESPDPIATTVELLCRGHIIGWFEGRSEIGPRALGQRSILCDPRRPDGKEVLNLRVKHREAFRPFAPVVLLEEAANWFDLDGQTPESPFMLRVCKFREDRKSQVPAVVHADDTGRVQTVTAEANGRLYELVKRFHERTGVPIILNTSFNVMGEPIVETPEDALLTTLSTGIDYCVLEGRIVEKRKQVLFEEDEVPWPLRVDDQIAASLKSAESGGGGGGDARPLKGYLGSFAHPTHGSLTVEIEGGQLKGTFRGALIFSMRRDEWSSPLRRHAADIFEITAQPFAGHRVMFIPDRRGRIDCVAFLVKRAFSRDLVFTRSPAEGADRQLARGFAGRYEGDGRALVVTAG